MKSCKIALAQINPILGNLAYNKNKILTVINKLSGKADLVVFPELSLIGYPPEDLILREKMICQLILGEIFFHKLRTDVVKFTQIYQN